jgi:glycosyltransferase involved in cell wall biosynthesis
MTSNSISLVKESSTSTESLDEIRSASVIIPVFNERDSIELVVRKTEVVLKSISSLSSFEIIIVDDGSVDGTTEVVAKLAKEIATVQGIKFRRNFGKSAALTAGFEATSGDVVITMDGDGQDDPEGIPVLLEKINSGYDLVSGWKKSRKDPLEKVIPSRLFNYVVSKVTGVKLHDFNSGFKAYRAWCVNKITLTGNLYRFLPVLVAQHGGKITEVPVIHHERKFGQSKFGIGRYLEGAFDLCTVVMLSRFFQKPLYFFGLIGFPLMIFGGLIGFYLLSGHIYFLFSGDYSYQLVARPLLQISVTLFGIGLHIFLIGLLAELVLSRSPQRGYDIEKRL